MLYGCDPKAYFQDCEALLFALTTCKQRYIKYPGFTFFTFYPYGNSGRQRVNVVCISALQRAISLFFVCLNAADWRLSERPGDKETCRQVRLVFATCRQPGRIQLHLDNGTRHSFETILGQVSCLCWFITSRKNVAETSIISSNVQKHGRIYSGRKRNTLAVHVDVYFSFQELKSVHWFIG